jgi:hypothetical protein
MGAEIAAVEAAIPAGLRVSSPAITILDIGFFWSAHGWRLFGKRIMWSAD